MKVRIKKLAKGGPSPLYQQDKNLGLDAYSIPMQFKEKDKEDSEEIINNNEKIVKRENANVELEKGEVVLKGVFEANENSNNPQMTKVGGKPHSKGGSPAILEPGDFVFSHYLKMDEDEIKVLGGKGKGISYADFASKYIKDFNKSVHDLKTSDDKHKQETAALNVQNITNKLMKLAMLQEAKKGFPNEEMFEAKKGGLYKMATGGSIVDYLKEQGLPSDYNNRKRLAEMLGIKDYRGSASQNLNILDRIRKNPELLTYYAKMEGEGYPEYYYEGDIGYIRSDGMDSGKEYPVMYNQYGYAKSSKSSYKPSEGKAGKKEYPVYYDQYGYYTPSGYRYSEGKDSGKPFKVVNYKEGGLYEMAEAGVVPESPDPPLYGKLIRKKFRNKEEFEKALREGYKKDPNYPNWAYKEIPGSQYIVSGGNSKYTFQDAKNNKTKFKTFWKTYGPNATEEDWKEYYIKGVRKNKGAKDYIFTFTDEQEGHSEQNDNQPNNQPNIIPKGGTPTSGVQEPTSKDPKQEPKGKKPESTRSEENLKTYEKPFKDTGYGVMELVDILSPFVQPINRYAPIKKRVEPEQVNFRPVDFEAQRQAVKGQVQSAQNYNNLISPTASAASVRNAQIMAQSLDPLNQSFMQEFNTNQMGYQQQELQNAQIRNQANITNAELADRYDTNYAKMNVNFDARKAQRFRNFLQKWYNADRNRQTRNMLNYLMNDYEIGPNQEIRRIVHPQDRMENRIFNDVATSSSNQTTLVDQAKAALLQAGFKEEQITPEMLSRELTRLRNQNLRVPNIRSNELLSNPLILQQLFGTQLQRQAMGNVGFDDMID